MTYNAEINGFASGFHAPTYSDFEGSTYKDRLNRWAIARLSPDQHPAIVARFRSRSDADGHLQFLCQRLPDDRFVVIFDRQGF